MQVALIVLLLTSVAILAMRRLDDPDTWWHLAAGRYIVTHHAIPQHDVFSYTAQERPWIDVQWMFDVVLYAAYQVAGVPALIMGTAAAAVLTFAILLRMLRGAGPLPATIALALALLTMAERLLPRPEMFSLIFCATYLALLEGHPANGRQIWLILPLQVLWANIHGVFVVGPVLVGAYAAGRTLAVLLAGSWRTRRAEVGRLWAVAAAAPLLCVVNPYGIRGALLPLTLLTRISSERSVYASIGEFQPPLSASMTPVLWCYVILIGLSALGFVFCWRRVRLDRLLAWGAFLTLSLMARRNMSFFALAAVAPAADGLAAIGNWLAAQPRWRAVLGVVRPGFAAGIAIALAGLIFVAVTNRAYWWTEQRRQSGISISPIDFPIGAADFLERLHVSGRVFNDLHAGGYLTWRSFPNHPVFIDGRLEVYDEAFFARYFDALGTPATFDALAAQYEFNCVLLFHGWQNRWPLIMHLATSQDWALVYVDETGVVFVRNDADNVAVAQAAAPELSRQLAGNDAPTASGWWASAVWPLQAAHVHLQRGSILYVLGQVAGAARELQAAVQLRPDFLDARVRLGYARWQLGQHDAARAEWSRALATDPTFEPAREALHELTAQ